MTEKQVVIGAIIVIGLGWLIYHTFATQGDGGPTIVRTASVTVGTPTVTGSAATAGGTDYSTTGIDPLTGGALLPSIATYGPPAPTG